MQCRHACLVLLLLELRNSIGSPVDNDVWPEAVARLVPMPQSVAVQKGASLELKEAGLVVCLSGAALGDDEGRLAHAIRREIGQRSAGGLVVVLEPNAGADECQQAATQRGKTPVLVVQHEMIKGFEGQAGWAPHSSDPEAYMLVANDALVEISAFGETGAFRGAQTLMQICLNDDLANRTERRGGGCRIPPVKIRDWPDLKNRGVMLDISRNRVHTMNTLKLMVDSFAALKFNQLQMYTEHTFAYRAHATVWADTGAVTPEEARELSYYCHQRFITLVPNQQSFGHMQHWLKHDEYRHLAESRTGSSALWRFEYCCHMFSDPEFMPYSLAPDARSLALLRGLYDELLEAFPYSRAINIGMDETYDLGDGVSRNEVQRSGKHTVYANFLKNITNVLQQRGAHPMFWGDIFFEHPHLFLKSLPKDAIVMDWGYEADAPFAQRGAALQQHKIKWYACPGTSSWLSLGGRVTNSLRNVINAASSAAAYGAEGLLLTDWGDGGHLQPPPVSFPGFITAADFSWNARVPQGSTAWRGGGGMAPGRRLTLKDVMDRAADGIDRLFLARHGPVLGQVLMMIGQIYQKVGRGTNPNRSVLFDLLVLANRKSTLVRRDVIVGHHLRRDSLQSALRELSDAQSQLDLALSPSSASSSSSSSSSSSYPRAAAWGNRTATWDASLLFEEVSWVVGMLRVSCQLGLVCVEHTRDGSVCNLAALPHEETRGVTESLERLTLEAKRLWTRRSRPGQGFKDTLRRLRHTSDVLKNGERGDVETAWQEFQTWFTDGFDQLSSKLTSPSDTSTSKLDVGADGVLRHAQAPGEL